MNLSEKTNRKFINTVDLSDWEIETDTGWEPITYIHKTIPYQKWSIVTENGLILECADDHIIFLEDFSEIYIKNLEIGDFIHTYNGLQKIEKIYFSTEEDDFKKPWCYDEFDTCVIKKGYISHWCKLNKPINEELV